MHPGPRGALPAKADAPDLHRVVAVFSQAPEGTGPSGGVHLADHPLSWAILSLQKDNEREKGSLTPLPGHRLNPALLNTQAKGIRWKGQLEAGHTSSQSLPRLAGSWGWWWGYSETQGHKFGEQKGDSYLLGNGVANDDVAFWDVPGHSGRVGSEVSDCHIHRRWRPVCECRYVSRLTGSTHRLALASSHLELLYSPARTKPRSQLTSRRTVGLR